MKATFLLVWCTLIFAQGPGNVPLMADTRQCAVRPVHIKTAGRSNPRSEFPELHEMVRGKRSGYVSQQIAALTSAELVNLDGQAFVEAVATAGMYGLLSLWNADADTSTVFSPSRLSLIANAATNGRDGDPSRLDSFIYFIEIAYRHEERQADISYDPALKAQVGLAVLSAGWRADFLSSGDPALDSLRLNWSRTIDTVDVTLPLLGRIEEILALYRNPIGYYEHGITANLFDSLINKISQNAEQGSNSPWYHAINTSLVNVIRDWAIDRNDTGQTRAVIESAIDTLGWFGVLDAATATAARGALSDAWRIQDRFSASWVTCVLNLDEFYDATLDDGTVLDQPALRAELTDIVLPNEYVYEDGRFTFITPLPETTTDLVYDSLMEVRAQFFRKTTFLDPVPNDPNENLTIVLYESQDHYRAYQTFLYGTDTNNGGINVESQGTFFIYDRTPGQGRFTLEEIARHEYVHYLDNRYVIHGSFNEAPIYENDRMTWYNEGLADWLVGSTRDQGVLTLEGSLDIIRTDPTRMTIADFIGISYASGSRFYRYAALFLNYLDQHRNDLLVRLFSAIRTNDLVLLDTLYNEMKTDSTLQANYDAFIDARLAEVQAGTGLFSENVPTVRTPDILPAGNLNAIQTDLSTSLPVTSITGGDGRYRAEGVLTLPVNGDPVDVLHERFELQLDQALVNLTPMSSNLVSAVAWFGDVTVTGNTAQASFIVDGPYNDDVPTPPATPTALAPAVVGNAVHLYWNANTEPDLTGYRVYRSSSSGGPVLIAETTTPNYIDDNLAPGAWYYAVSAYSPGGESVATTEVGTVILAATRLALHRYWNGSIGNHFYTTDFSTYGSGDATRLYEGIECYVEANPVPGSLPLNRYWNAGIGDHFYTTDWLGTDPFWTFERVEGFVHATQLPGTVPLYRYWNAGIGDHFYTKDWNTFGNGTPTWVYEGVQCYVYTSP